MKKLALCLVAGILFLGCQQKSVQKNKKEAAYTIAKKEVLLVRAKQSLFYSILDSVIAIKQKCSNDSSTYVIWFTYHSIDSTLSFQSEFDSVIRETFSYSPFKACLRYKGYRFVTDSIDNYWVEKTAGKSVVSYKSYFKIPPPPPAPNDDQTIIKIKGNKFVVKLRETCSNPSYS
ncbi:hypothetical protein [Paludibacter jiangxiensis]|uniref:Lipoprotein n=1 Tax=Paludibacter jiangxiensis TaxID=681398 RepID=A0A170YP36_9BACT|nr:hypothetical protein [Paludibacter jiangxiensis]GAT61950.1 hypothetical protein PJIAN_1539 [Paludibacter jiangxiensis]